MTSLLHILGEDVERALEILSEVRERLRRLEADTSGSVNRSGDWQSWARTFIEEWCRSETKPILPPGLEVADMEVVPLSPGVLPSPTHRVVLREARLPGPFVRLSPTGEEWGAVWPHPDTLPDPVQQFLFTGLPADWSKRAVLVQRLEPRIVQRSGDGHWEVT